MQRPGHFICALAVTGLFLAGFLRAIFYLVMVFAVLPSSGLEPRHAKVSFISMPNHIAILHAGENNDSVIFGQIGKSFEWWRNCRKEIFLGGREKGFPCAKWLTMNFAHCADTDLQIPRTLKVNRWRFSEVGEMGVHNDLASPIRIFVDFISRKPSYPNIGSVADSERFVAVNQSLSSNSDLSGGILSGLFGLTLENASLGLGFLKLSEKDNKSENQNSECYPTQGKRVTFKPTKLRVFLDTYRYFLAGLLIGFVFLVGRISAEILWEYGWWYRGLRRCYFSFGGRRFDPIWECEVRALFILFLCALAGVILFHGLIALQLI